MARNIAAASKPHGIAPAACRGMSPVKVPRTQTAMRRGIARADTIETGIATVGRARRNVIAHATG